MLDLFAKYRNARIYFLFKQVWCRSAKFLWKSKFCSRSGFGSGSWFYFGFQYQTYISYIEDTHQILFGSANSFESYCVHMKNPRTYVHPDIQTDRRADGRTDRRKFFFYSSCLLTYTKHEHSSKGENFLSTHAITILSLFKYSVCDETVKKNWSETSFARVHQNLRQV